MAPLQKRALYSLLIGLALTAAFVIVLVVQGDLTAFDRDTNIRMVMYAAMVGVPLVFLIMIAPLKRPTQMDERDKVIIEKSRITQYFGIIISLAAWTISLTEVYHDQGQVPIPYLTLIFASTLIVSALSQSVGILLGYRSMNRNA